ncbi:TonB-dependent receptor [Natronoflexus pectinivorans]|uniref:Iron complex outermembrane receptor protein n=1 Tax=Natronoflexus pectinivorans TaxID=682526 RepID=A0A4R2GJB5_9BACT|nr:TonB-dependent receptor [Natronoflexus pectinivorans]TCO08412.1 iron complex outermembrane receptor protein [Natronoflexus pectinivorans]
MKIQYKFYIILIILFTGLNPSHATNIPHSQRPRTDANIFGHVVDADTKEHLPFVNIVVKGTRIGTITDVSGHYLLTNLPEGRHILQVHSMGYAMNEVEIVATANTTKEVDIELKSTSINLAEVTLTASPTASGFRYQPDAVFMGEQIQRRSEPSFGEMLNGQPGVSMRSFGSAPARPVIRGMDGDRILVLENGERMGDISETSADHAISLDPLAATRVEVIRGPASLLYGSSALGGVINLMTTDIPDQWDPGLTGVVSGQTATMNNMGAGFGRMTYGGEKNAFTARASMRKSGDITTPEGKLPGTSMENYDAAMGWGVNGKNGNGLTGGLSFSISDQTFEIPESIDDPDESVEIRAQRMSFQGRFGKNIQGRFFDQAQIRFNASHFSQQEVEIEIEEDGSIDEDVELEYDQYAFSSTLTLQHKPIGILARGAMGLSVTGQNLDVGGDEAYTPGERRFTVAAFTFQEVPMTNMLRFQFGLRLDFMNSKALSNEVFDNIDLTRNRLNYSGSLGLNFRPTPGMEIGAQLARSHRNPMVEELYAEGMHLGAGVYERGNPTLNDEIGHGGDLFIRYKRGIIEMELATFINNFHNYIIFQPTGVIHEASGYPEFEYVDGKARLHGGEFTIAASLFDGLTLQTGLDLVRGRRIFDDASNENLPFIPPFRVRSQIEYDFGRVWLGASHQIVNRQSRVAPEEDKTDGYSLVGFQAGYRMNRMGNHVFILRVENAFDTKYRDHLSRIEDRNFVMPGRNVNLSYRWFF